VARGGLWLLSGKAERSAVLVLSIAMVAIAALVLFTQPAAWTDPFGGVSKNLGLLACAAAVWILAPLCPCAQNANPKKNTKQ
jgi:uncharacterized membrane protein YraQ (UPF0718 family)